MLSPLPHKVGPVACLVVCLGSPACAEEPPPSPDPSELDLAGEYLDERDRRAAEFCTCFHTLRGYPEGDVDACVEGEALEGHQRGCILGIFEPDPEADPDDPRFTSAPALECLIDAEKTYTTCLSELACDDIDGLDACIRDYNDGRDACPRLSEDDEGKFESCLLL